MQSELSSCWLSGMEEGMLGRLALESRLSLDEFSDHLEEAARLVGLGHARFAAVAYPWGVEFDLEITPAGRSIAQKTGGANCDQTRRQFVP